MGWVAERDRAKPFVSFENAEEYVREHSAEMRQGLETPGFLEHKLEFRSDSRSLGRSRRTSNDPWSHIQAWQSLAFSPLWRTNVNAQQRIVSLRAA